MTYLAPENVLHAIQPNPLLFRLPPRAGIRLVGMHEVRPLRRIRVRL